MFKKILSIVTAMAIVIAGIQFSPAQNVNAAVTSSAGSGWWNIHNCFCI